MDIWVIGTLNNLFIRGFHTQIKYSKNKVVSDKTPLFVIGPFCIRNSICINIGFGQGNFVRKCCVFLYSTFH